LHPEVLVVVVVVECDDNGFVFIGWAFWKKVKIKFMKRK